MTDRSASATGIGSPKARWQGLKPNDPRSKMTTSGTNNWYRFGREFEPLAKEVLRERYRRYASARKPHAGSTNSDLFCGVVPSEMYEEVRKQIEGNILRVETQEFATYSAFRAVVPHPDPNLPGEPRIVTRRAIDVGDNPHKLLYRTPKAAARDATRPPYVVHHVWLKGNVPVEKQSRSNGTYILRPRTPIQLPQRFTKFDRFSTAVCLHYVALEVAPDEKFVHTNVDVWM